ncbi:hypothetical protein B0H13DRAFT_2326698 [Mycena leptocephala]|nr:hypothetical protein B0H13DRAFT_2326698 [Mycena leptocephala]
MDIKFVGSGASAKGILYYITDYITKSQLKTHVAFAMLELAVKKLGEFNPSETDIAIRAKQMLQKCAYTMISHLKNPTTSMMLKAGTDKAPSNELSDCEDEDEENESSPLLNDIVEPTDASHGIDDDDEIRVSIDSDGCLIPTENQLPDYQHRREELGNTSRM